MATNTVLIDCNQQESVEARSDNATSNAMWTNKVSEGLMLNPGDRVSISSAFINEVGSGEDTIQFTDGDNSATLTMQYYKCTDGENCLILPRKWCYDSPSIKSSTADANTDETASLPAHFASPPDVAPYQELYRRKHDGRRYTIMKQNFLHGDADYDPSTGRPFYEMHEESVTLSLPVGYHSATNICELLTEQLHLSSEPQALGTYSMAMTSPTFRPFVCANATNYSKAEYSSASKWNPYDFVGILDPELYTAGKALGYESVVTSTTTSVTTNWDYTPTTLAAIQKLFDAQARRGDLIFGNGATVANARFLHMEFKEPAAAQKFGDDDDVSKASCRIFVAYSDNYSWATNDGGKIQLLLAGDKIHKGITTTAGASPLGNRRIGFDTHFSAYGVDAVLLWNGYDNVNWPSSGSLDEVYLGANNPSVSFDNSHARFTVSQLHTAHEQINTASAGEDAGEKSSQVVCICSQGHR